MRPGILLMTYGSPRTLDEVEGYFTDIRGGRQPSPEAVEELSSRYARIGGSPLPEITVRQAQALESRLAGDAQGGWGPVPVFVGMKHWHPFIAEAVDEIVSAGVDTLVGIALAPHYSRMSIGGYEDRVQAAREARGADFDLRMVRSWYREPAFVDFVAGRLLGTLEGWDASDPSTRVVFTAHSLPERILVWGDPYRDELLDSARMIAEAAGIGRWELAFQSASQTGEPWLGPDVLERLTALAGEGGRRAVVAPIGFTADHLEILFDVDVECMELAERLGLELRRLPSPNDDPGFIEVLAGIARGALSAPPRNYGDIRTALHPRPLQRPALRSGRDEQGSSYASSLAYGKGTRRSSRR
jgi:protoporphyrin/coproporphyrin ferrochelatase